jgi:Predicted EndoIII-related endonuclease
MKISTDDMLAKMEEMFPDAHCELNHSNAIELVISVVLSAQTTDQAVNKVTPALFSAYPTLADYEMAEVEDIEQYIKRIGLYRNKAKHIKELTRQKW